jgi:hypothetical protein
MFCFGTGVMVSPEAMMQAGCCAFVQLLGGVQHLSFVFKCHMNSLSSLAILPFLLVVDPCGVVM